MIVHTTYHVKACDEMNGHHVKYMLQINVNRDK